LDPDVLAEPEMPGKPLVDPQAHQQFLHMAQQSRTLYQYFKDRVFWLAWQADSRGRYYSHGYHINLQAQEYKKALLSFNKEEYLTT
jgi:DNA-directed RNA polymerase